MYRIAACKSADYLHQRRVLICWFRVIRLSVSTSWMNNFHETIGTDSPSGHRMVDCISVV